MGHRPKHIARRKMNPNGLLSCSVMVLSACSVALALIWVIVSIAFPLNPVEDDAGALPTTTTQTSPTTTTTPVKKSVYELTRDERELVERVVMAESGYESQDGQIAVAECILNACLKTGDRPATVVEEYHYTSRRLEPTDEVKHSVSAVFDDGLRVVGEGVLFFYAPKYTESPWHESQTYVRTIGGHRFFKERGCAV